MRSVTVYRDKPFDLTVPKRRDWQNYYRTVGALRLRWAKKCLLSERLQVWNDTRLRACLACNMPHHLFQVLKPAPFWALVPRIAMTDFHACGALPVVQRQANRDRPFWRLCNLPCVGLNDAQSRCERVISIRCRCSRGLNRSNEVADSHPSFNRSLFSSVVLPLRPSIEHATSNKEKKQNAGRDCRLQAVNSIINKVR